MKLYERSNALLRSDAFEKIRRAVFGRSDTTLELRTSLLSWDAGRPLIEAIPPASAGRIANDMSFLLARRRASERLVVLKKCSLSDQGFISRDGNLLVPEHCFPPYVVSLIRESPAFRRQRDLIRDAAPKRSEGTIIALYHPHAHIYGHFLMEAFVKLPIVRFLYDNGWKVPIYIHIGCPQFIAAFIKCVIPDAVFFFAEMGLKYQFDNIIVPSFDDDYLLNEFRLSFFDEFAENIGSRESLDGVQRKIFIHRAVERGLRFRHLANQDELESVARAHGYEIVSPETLSPVEQVALFRTASHVAGEYSSSLHNAIFAGAGTAVLAFNYINLVQLAIALTRGQRLTIFCPRSGEFIDENQHETVDFEIDVDAFHHALARDEPSPRESSRGPARLTL